MIWALRHIFNCIDQIIFSFIIKHFFLSKFFCFVFIATKTFHFYADVYMHWYKYLYIKTIQANRFPRFSAMSVYLCKILTSSQPFVVFSPYNLIVAVYIRSIAHMYYAHIHQSLSTFMSNRNDFFLHQTWKFISSMKIRIRKKERKNCVKKWQKENGFYQYTIFLIYF